MPRRLDCGVRGRREQINVLAAILASATPDAVQQKTLTSRSA